MTKIEIACVVIGLVLMTCSSVKLPTEAKDSFFWSAVLLNAVRFIISGAMVLLPLYFNFWR